ncbi:putative leucine-rich repeat receptor-like protein kinase, partial [Ananas comosus]
GYFVNSLQVVNYEDESRIVPGSMGVKISGDAPERSPAIEVDELRTRAWAPHYSLPLGHIFDHDLAYGLVLQSQTWRSTHTSTWELDIANSPCSFNGTIPDELGNLRQLTFLVLNSNKFIGKTPATLGKLSNLSWLDLADNQLNGTLLMSMNASPGWDQLLNAQHL